MTANDTSVGSAQASATLVASDPVKGTPIPAPAVPSHPLGPVTAAEITKSGEILQASWPTGTKLHYKAITLSEPPKSVLAPYLAAERAGEKPAPLDRKTLVIYYLKGTENLHEAVINLTKGSIESNVRVGPFLHPNADNEEIVAVEKAALEYPEVQAEIAKLKLPEGAVVAADPWIYGSDGLKEGKFYDDVRLMQCYLYMRDPENPSEPDSCHYSFPLPISPVINPQTMELVRVDLLPTGHDEVVEPLKPWKPVKANEYIPEAQTLRNDLKPLRVLQPEGASFTVEDFSELGKTIRWQKWDFKVGFNYREGMVLYDVHYDNKPLFYRISLSDMAIPYADPRTPYHRKCAFDLGDCGAGVMANNLQLGCDCLGSIYYISGLLADSEGKPTEMPNVICVHEQDAGISWKHTNYRTGRAVVARNRELVLQSILTVANYEYILAFNFNIAGDLTYEARATGILSTSPVDADLSTTPHPYGTIVHPGVLAAYHQHFFSLRIDPMIAGHNNRIAYDEAYALPRDPKTNPHGTGYTVKKTEITTTGGYDLDFSKGRIFKILNPSVRNPINGLPVGYKVMAPPVQPILADKDSYHYKRAEFADRNFYVTKYHEDELFAGGKFTNQSRGDNGVRSWAERRESLEDGDPVLWVNFGLQHIPRVEDYPVMPAEMLRVMLRPVNFFDKNPALDLPPSTQEFNCSVGLNKLVEKAEEKTGCCGSA